MTLFVNILGIVINSRITTETEVIKIVIITVNVSNVGMNRLTNKKNEIRIIPKDEIFKIFELIIKNRYFKHNLFSELKSLF